MQTRRACNWFFHYNFAFSIGFVFRRYKPLEILNILKIIVKNQNLVVTKHLYAYICTPKDRSH